MPYSHAEKLHEIEREISMRRRVYPREIATGSLSETGAARRLAILHEIAEDYRERIHAEPGGAHFATK